MRYIALPLDGNPRLRKGQEKKRETVPGVVVELGIVIPYEGGRTAAFLLTLDFLGATATVDQLRSGHVVSVFVFSKPSFSRVLHQNVG